MAVLMPPPLSGVDATDAGARGVRAAEHVQRCVGVDEMARGLEGKLDRDEWPMLKESVIRAAHQQCMMHLLQQQQQQQDAHDESTAAGCGAHERLGNASRRAAPPLHAWPSAARGAPSSGGAQRGRRRAARINGACAGGDSSSGRVSRHCRRRRAYRGRRASSKEFVCARAASAVEAAAGGRIASWRGGVRGGC